MTEVEPTLDHKLVNVDTPSASYKIHVVTNGVSRSPSQPTVIFISGLGSSCLCFCAVLRRLAASGIPAFAHDRAGIGRSGSVYGSPHSTSPDASINDDEKSTTSPKASPFRRPATEMASNLAMLLSTAEVPPPYVLVAHSYGGVIAREFINEHAADVLGIVLVDANCERAADRHIDVEALETLLATGEVNFFQVSGLNAQHKLRLDEWSEITGKTRYPPKPFQRGQGGAQAEKKGYSASCRGLARLQQYQKHVLGRRPVSVLRGNAEAEIRKVLNAADADHVGSDEVRAALRQNLTRCDAQEAQLQRDQLQLSEAGAGRMLDVRDSGHYIQVTHPEITTDEIKWVLAEIDKRGSLKEWRASNG